LHHSKTLDYAGVLRWGEAGQRRFIWIEGYLNSGTVGMLSAGVGAVRKRHRS